MMEDTYRLEDIHRHASRLILLSGCSGGGKSTLLAALARRGFVVFEEPGRQIVKEQLFIGGDALPWRDLPRFVELAASRSTHQMASAARSGKLCFFDRGLVDAVSALEHGSVPVPPSLETAVERLRYADTVFVTPPWPELFATDAERRHGFDEAASAYSSLQRTFERLRYRCIELPRTDVETRVEFILRHLVRRS
jgi:predicted ATPase